MKARAAVPAVIILAATLAGCDAEGYGGIAKIDTTAHTVKLFTGDTYTFDASADLSKFKVGDDVTITYNYDAATKKNVAKGISILNF